MRPLDDMAVGLDTGAITRGRAIKLAGATLVASALAAVGASSADAQEIETESLRKKRRRCNQNGGEFCATRSGRRNCDVCCGEGGRRRKACCGRNGCSCCRPRQRCHNGDCRRH